MSSPLEILKKYWGYPGFRPLQEDVINHILDKKDTLALMPTGGGKSLTFQVPAMVNEGICLVVTPLIALMKDQVENLQKRGIRALAIHSGLNSHEIDITLENAIFGKYKFLYVSPERLESELFITRVQKMNVNLLAVDEAHCISQWGYDFRPAYLRIANIREFFPEVPVLALTATAIPEVAKDIMDKLLFKAPNLLKKDFQRTNLVYFVKNTDDKFKSAMEVLNSIRGSGIIYVRSRSKAKEIAYSLRKNQVSADFYHAGLDTDVRARKQEAWLTNKIRVIVATNAFGMGIDKPNVRYVLHMDMPDTLEEYFQEAGRAGRDERKAFAVLLYNESDQVKAKQRLKNNFPELETVKRVYQALGNYYQIPEGAGKGLSVDFNLMDFASGFKLSSYQAYSSLKILQAEGYISLTDEINNPSKLIFLVNRDDLYAYQLKNASLDTFIKLLLRSFTGVFSQYVKVDESWLAKQAGVSIDVIFQYLNRLSSQKIINYIPKKKTPVLFFIEERLDAKNLHLSRKHFLERKQQYSHRLDHVLQYASTHHRCRSQLLLAYFGQKDVPLCGQCDVCRKRAEQGVSPEEILAIETALRLALASGPLLLDDLVDRLEAKKEKILQVIQWMVDDHKLQNTEAGEISLIQ